VRAAVIERRELIQTKLRDRSYLSYPASAVIADVSDYAHVYSVRGAIDAMKAAMASRVLVAQENAAGTTKPAKPTPEAAQPAATPP